MPDDSSRSERLRRELGRLHITAGEPSVRIIARKSGGAISSSTVQNVLHGAKFPRWGPLEQVVRALDGSVEEFHQLWVEARTAQLDGPAPDGGDVVEEEIYDPTDSLPAEDAGRRAERIIADARGEAHLLIGRARREAALIIAEGQRVAAQLAREAGTIPAGERTTVERTIVDEAQALDRLEPTAVHQALAAMPLQRAALVLTHMSGTRAVAALGLYPVDDVAALLGMMESPDGSRLLQRMAAEWSTAVLDAMPPRDAVEIMLGLPANYAAKVTAATEPYRVADFLTALPLDSSVRQLAGLIDNSPDLAARAIKLIDPTTKADVVRGLPAHSTLELLLELDAFDASRLLAMIGTDSTVQQLTNMAPIDAGERLVAMNRAQATDCLSTFLTGQEAVRILARILEAVEPDDAARLLLDVAPTEAARCMTVMDRAAVIKVLDAMGMSEATKMIEAMRPSVAARVLTIAAPEDAARRLSAVTPSNVVSILRAMSPTQAGLRIAAMPRPRAGMLLEEIEPHLAATILHGLTLTEREECLEAITPTARRTIDDRLERVAHATVPPPGSKPAGTPPRHLKEGVAPILGVTDRSIG